jgi:hypothetical protein
MRKILYVKCLTIVLVDLNAQIVKEHAFDDQTSMNIQIVKLESDIDILCQFSYYNSNNDLYAQVIVFNENGSVLFATDIDNRCRIR